MLRIGSVEGVIYKRLLSRKKGGIVYHGVSDEFTNFIGYNPIIRHLLLYAVCHVLVGFIDR